MTLPDSPSRRTRRRRPLALAAAAALAVVGLTACGTGQSWVDEGLSPAGNGQFITLGPVQAQNLTLVQGPEGARSVTLVGNLLNNGTTKDALVSASLNGAAETPAFISDGTITLLPAGANSPSMGYGSGPQVNFFGVDVQTSHYVPVTLRFESAGQTTVSLLVMAPTGYYEGIAPSATPTS